MAEVLFATLESDAGHPAQDGTLANAVAAFSKFISVQGPYKVETRLYQTANGDDFAASDTFQSSLAHPLFGRISVMGDLETTALTPSILVNSLESDTNFRTITVLDADTIDALGLVIEIFGY